MRTLLDYWIPLDTPWSSQWSKEIRRGCDSDRLSLRWFCACVHDTRRDLLAACHLVNIVHTTRIHQKSIPTASSVSQVGPVAADRLNDLHSSWSQCQSECGTDLWELHVLRKSQQCVLQIGWRLPLCRPSLIGAFWAKPTGWSHTEYAYSVLQYTQSTEYRFGVLLEVCDSFEYLLFLSDRYGSLGHFRTEWNAVGCFNMRKLYWLVFNSACMQYINLGEISTYGPCASSLQIYLV